MSHVRILGPRNTTRLGIESLLLYVPQRRSNQGYSLPQRKSSKNNAIFEADLNFGAWAKFRAKGQQISKAICAILNSSKQRIKKQNKNILRGPRIFFFVHFLEELRIPEIAFTID